MPYGGPKIQNTYLDTLRKLQRPRELAIVALTHCVSALVHIGGLLCLGGDRQLPALDVDMDVLLGHARELEDGGHLVLLTILVEIHPTGQI